MFLREKQGTPSSRSPPPEGSRAAKNPNKLIGTRNLLHRVKGNLISLEFPARKLFQNRKNSPSKPKVHKSKKPLKNRIKREKMTGDIMFILKFLPYLEGDLFPPGGPFPINPEPSPPRTIPRQSCDALPSSTSRAGPPKGEGGKFLRRKRIDIPGFPKEKAAF